jgi:hypothetical protein
VTVVLVAALVAGYVADSRSAPHPRTLPRLPLAGAVMTGGATWAVLDMGKPTGGQNFFWQLVTAASDADAWRLVTPPGVADNGGLVVAPTVGGLVAGFLPSQELAFSPLAITVDGGRTWTPGVLPQPLAASPSALDAAAQPLAAVGGGDAALLARGDSWSSWRVGVPASSVLSQPSALACGLTGITAVASGAATLLGGRCTTPGVLPVFELDVSAGVWHQVGAPTAARRLGQSEIVRLSSSFALVLTTHAGGTALVAAWAQGADQWALSSVRAVPRGGRVMSSSPTSGGGADVVIRTATGWLGEAVTRSGRWHDLPTLPADTQVLAPRGDSVDALVTHGRDLTVWRLSGSTWSETQRLVVPLEYGSSN